MPWPSQHLNIGGSVAGTLLIFMLVFAFQQPCQRMVAAVVQVQSFSFCFLAFYLVILQGEVVEFYCRHIHCPYEPTS